MDQSLPPQVQSVRAPAGTAVIFVCTECSGSKKLRRSLKDAVKEHGWKKRIRVVAAACLDICPKDGVTLAIAPVASGSLRTVVARGRAGVEGLLDSLVG